MFAAVLPSVAAPTAGAAEVPIAGGAEVPTAGAAEVPHATVPPIASPATVLSFSVFNISLRNELQGVVCQSPNVCGTVRYPSFATSSGLTALEKALATTSAGKVIVYGYSNGAEVAEAWLAEHLDDPGAPSPDVLSFVLFGNPTRDSGDGQHEVWTQSPYQIIDVARQYDGMADLPNNKESPHYLLAAINASIGFWTIHTNYNRVDIHSPANAVWQVGNVTYIRTPTQNLPILGVMALFLPSLNERMKAQIETAYIRPVPFPTAIQSPLPPATEPVVSTAPAVASSPVEPQRSAAIDSAPAPLASTPGPASPVVGQNAITGTDAGLSGSGPSPTTPPADRADASGITDDNDDLTHGNIGVPGELSEMNDLLGQDLSGSISDDVEPAETGSVLGNDAQEEPSLNSDGSESVPGNDTQGEPSQNSGDSESDTPD